MLTQLEIAEWNRIMQQLEELPLDRITNDLRDALRECMMDLGEDRVCESDLSPEYRLLVRRDRAVLARFRKHVLD